MRPPPDFEAEYHFLSAAEGGRKSPPSQGYRSDLVYDGDRFEDGMYMVWPRFLGPDGVELPEGPIVPVSGKANFYIINEKMRVEVHIHRIKPGTKFFMMEGPHRVAVATVSKILALNENARKGSA